MTLVQAARIDIYQFLRKSMILFSLEVSAKAVDK